MNGKNWYTSKTFVGNLIALVISVATMIADPSLAFDPGTVRIAIIVAFFGNMALRLVTSKPINGTRAAREQPPTMPTPGDA